MYNDYHVSVAIVSAKKGRGGLEIEWHMSGEGHYTIPYMKTHGHRKRLKTEAQTTDKVSQVPNRPGCIQRTRQPLFPHST